GACLMAGDWLKMRTDLYRDPKVCMIADALMDGDSMLSRYVNQNMQRDMTVTRNVTRNATVGALLSVWGVLRHRGKRDGEDLVCKNVSLSVIDDITDIPGFGDAMEAVGWVVNDDACLVFPRFFAEYNVDAAEAKALKAAARQKRYRERQKSENSDVTRDVTRDVTVTHRVEKSREEIKPSVTNVTGAAQPITDPAEIIFGYGVPLLTASGSTDKQARSFLGGLRKQHGDAALIDKLRDCLKEKPLQPVEWLAAALPPKGGHGKSRHSGFENINYRAGVGEDGRF
ncbi:MAG TPA: hypothetical protein PK620_14950, partial [Denitromonas sp.]|nr:hypothetical protein [Denitromonas sp.]